MIRVTADLLRSKVFHLNESLGLPTEYFGPADGTSAQTNIGHLHLEELPGQYRYRLVRIVNINGGELGVSSRLTAREMYCLLTGLELAKEIFFTKVNEIMKGN